MKPERKSMDQTPEERALAWADREGEEDEARGRDAWEPTYADGSVKHECWDDREAGDTRRDPDER